MAYRGRYPGLYQAERGKATGSLRGPGMPSSHTQGYLSLINTGLRYPSGIVWCPPSTPPGSRQGKTQPLEPSLDLGLQEGPSCSWLSIPGIAQQPLAPITSSGKAGIWLVQYTQEPDPAAILELPWLFQPWWETLPASLCKDPILASTEC